MSGRLLLDENVEHEIEHRLRESGYDIEHVAALTPLGEGTSDRSVARYARETERIIVTYDDDFVIDMTDTDYPAVLYVPKESLDPTAVTAIVDQIARYYPFEEIDGVVHAGSEWL